MKNFLRLLAVPLILFSLGCSRDKGELGTANNPVKFFFVPSVDAHVLTEKTKDLKAFLEKHTGYSFKIQVPTSFIAVVEAFGTKRADIASMNTFGYILANQKFGAEALITVERFGHTEYKGQFLTKAGSDIKSLKDIAGKKIAYVDPASTSGYLLPASMLKDANIAPKEMVFAQRHDNVVTMVRQGQVDVGATFYSPKEEGKIQDARRLVLKQYPNIEKEVKILQLTKPIPNDPIVFRKGLTAKMKEDIQLALISYVRTEQGRKVFHEMYGVTNMVASTDANYDGVRDILKELGKKATELVKR